MSDELEFSSGGGGGGEGGGGLAGATIETAEMARDAAALGIVAELANGWERHLAAVMSWDADLAPQWWRGSVSASAFTARAGARSVADGAERSGAALLEAAARYGDLEQRLTLLLQGGGALLGWAAGCGFNPLTAAVLLGSLGTFAGGLALGTVVGAIDLDALVEGLRQHPELVVNPVFVTLIATLIASVDDAAMGALGLPLPVAALLGDQALGLSGTDTAAVGVVTLGALLAALGLPLFQRSGFELRPPISGVARAPVSLSAAAGRIPPSEDGVPQIRIEQYVHPDGSTGWIIYATGTVEWSPLPGAEPSDLTSNVGEVAGLGSEMRDAISAAMRDAGIALGDEVVTVGHSQAGMVLAGIAAEGGYTVVAELSFGAPSRQIPLPDGAIALAFEHGDDVVPVLGGVAVAPAQSVARTVIERTAFAGRAVPAGEFFAAHQMTEYAETARLADASAHPAVIDFIETMDRVTGGQQAQVTEWRADRVWAEGSLDTRLAPPG